jgi:hypothetical protein
MPVLFLSLSAAAADKIPGLAPKTAKNPSPTEQVLQDTKVRRPAQRENKIPAQITCRDSKGNTLVAADPGYQECIGNSSIHSNSPNLGYPADQKTGVGLKIR